MKGERRETAKTRALGLGHSVSQDYRQLFGRHPDTWSCYQVAVSGAFQRVVNGKPELSTNQRFKALFPSDDGGVLKQVKLTGQQPGPLCPAPLRENLTEGGDDWTV